MNSIRQTQALNRRELDAAVPPSASWHADYRDTAHVYIGGFPLDLSEGDLLTIFSQYGNPTHMDLVRDRETGKSRGFAFLKYEDQRSCDLSVDNLGGAEVLGRVLRVDHTRYRKRRKKGNDGDDDEGEEETGRVERWEGEWDSGGGEEVTEDSGDDDDDDGDGIGHRKRQRRKRAMIKEEKELEELMQIKEGEEEDPMKQYLIEQKKEEVGKALARMEKKHRHRHKHRSREDDREHRSHRHRHRHRDDVDKDPGHRYHHREEGHRHPRGRKERDDEDDERKPHGPARKHTFEDGLSRSRSAARRRRSRERSDSRSRHRRPMERELPSSRRERGPKHDSTSSRSRSRSPLRARRLERR